MSELQEYLTRLQRQVPEVKEIREAARSRGDLVTVASADKLLGEWETLIATFTPANDTAVGQVLWSEQIVPRIAATPLGPMARFVCREIGGLWLVFRDRRTPWYAKAVAVLACLFAISPIDLTPDGILHVGYFDDPTLLVLGTLLSARLASPLVLTESRNSATSSEQARALRGSCAISSIWLAAVLITTLHVWRPVV